MRWLIQIQSMSFPRCDGHGGADFAETTDVKKPTGEVGFFTVPLQS
ncbi:hypothetical protein ECXG_04066 [Escherichia coli TA447]|uniref:Uncharacterized protein n=1 Tax=Escherichia coli TA447 TaxID=656447 RepID=A0A1X3ISM6_ECOLX|nr:hypothetical protein ECXG_04066 [Escherichia coli TA447]